MWPMLETENGESKVVIKMALLSCAPFVNKHSFTALTAAASVKSAYSAYGKKEESSDESAAERLIICFTLDNTNVNPKMASEFDKPMIGAYCHRLNLAAKQCLKEAFGGELEKDLDTIKAIMLRASTLKGRGTLKEFTPYVPEKNNET